jgi:cytochrome P450
VDKYEKYAKLVYNVREVFGGVIGFSEGENWRKKKRAISKIFHFDHIKANIPKINQICDRWLDKYEKNSKSEDNKDRFEMLGFSASVFNGVIMECFLGVDQTEEEVNGQRLEDMMVEAIVKTYVAGENPFLITFGKIVWDLGITQ